MLHVREKKTIEFLLSIATTTIVSMMAEWDLPVVLKKIQQFNRKKNKQLTSANQTSTDIANASSTNSEVNFIPKQLTSASAKRSYEVGVSRILGSCSSAGCLLTPISLDDWTRDHIKNRDWYRLRMSDTSLTLDEYGQIHSVCFIHALHEWSNTTQCSISFVLESLYIALDDLGYLHAVEDPARSPRSTKCKRGFISKFLQTRYDSSCNILLKWYHDEYLLREQNPRVKRSRPAAVAIHRDGNNGGDLLAAYADKVDKDEDDGNLTKMYTSALVSLPWVLMRCAYVSKKMDQEPTAKPRIMESSGRKVNLKTEHSSIIFASSVSSSRKRARDEFSVTDVESSSGNTSGHTGTLPTPFCFDIIIDERWKIEFLYIVIHTYVIHFYRQCEKNLPSWEGIDQFLNLFRKKWYSPMMEEIEMQGFSSLNQTALALYGMDTLSSYQYTAENDACNAAFQVTSCYLSSFGDDFLSIKTPWKSAPRNDKPIQLDRYNGDPNDTICIDGLYPRLMLQVLRQHGFVDKLSSLLFPQNHRSLIFSDYTPFSPKEETILELMKSFLSSNILDNKGYSVSAACARELQDAFYFIPTAFFLRTAKNIKMNEYNARSIGKVTDLFFTQLDMLLRLQDYDKACLLCNEISLNSVTSARAGDYWEILYEQIGKMHSAPNLGGDFIIFSHDSLCALWDILHLQPIGMLGIKTLEKFVEKQIDASINREDTTMVVNLQRFLFNFLRVRFGTCTSISSALGIQRWELLKTSIYDPQKGLNKCNPEILAKDLMRWNVETRIDNGMQYFVSSIHGESSSNGTGVFAIAKAEELNFDSQPSNELQTRSPLSYTPVILDTESHSNQSLLPLKLSAEHQVPFLDSYPRCDQVDAVCHSDTSKIALHDASENKNFLFGEKLKEQHGKSESSSHESDTDIPYKNDDNASHQDAFIICNEVDSSSSNHSEPNRDDERSWGADETEKYEASHEASGDSAELPNEDIIEINSTDDDGGSDTTSDGIENLSASVSESSETETKSYESDYDSKCSFDIQSDRSTLGNDATHFPSSSTEILTHYCNNTDSDIEGNSAESVDTSADEESCTSESSLRDSHEDQENIITQLSEEDEDVCMESNVASDVYREGAVPYNKCQSTEELEGVASKLNDQVAENLVSAKPSSPDEGIIDQETSSATSEKEKKKLPSAAEISILNKDDVPEEMAVIDDALPSQHLVHFADVCEVIYNKEVDIPLDKDADDANSNVPSARDLIKTEVLHQPASPDYCGGEGRSTERLSGKVELYEDVSALHGFSPAALHATFLNSVNDLEIFHNSAATTSESDKSIKRDEEQCESFFADYDVSEDIRDTVRTSSVPAEHKSMKSLFHEEVNAISNDDMHEKKGTIETSQLSQHQDRVSERSSVICEKEVDLGDIKNISKLTDSLLPLQGSLEEKLELRLSKDVEAHFTIHSQATLAGEPNKMSVDVRDIVQPDSGTAKGEKMHQSTEKMNALDGDDVNQVRNKTLASNQLVQLADGWDVVCLKETDNSFDRNVDTGSSEDSLPIDSTNLGAIQGPVAIFPNSLELEKTPTDSAINYFEVNADISPLQGSMTLSLDSTLRKDVKACADARSQAAAESEASKPKNDDQEPIESFSANVPAEKGKILSSTAEINAYNEDDVKDEMTVIEETQTVQHFQPADSHEAASNEGAETTFNEERKTGNSSVPLSSDTGDLIVSLFPAGRAEDKSVCDAEATEGFVSLQESTDINIVDIKAKDSFRTVAKLETNQIKEQDEEDREESLLTNTEISFEETQGNVGIGLLPAENENNSLPPSAKTDEFQEYGSHGHMVIIEKTQCSKSNFQTNISLDREVGAGDSKVSCEYSPIETESLENDVSALPKFIDLMRGITKLDATDLDDVYQNIDNQTTAANQNAACVACAHKEIGTSIEGIEHEIIANQVLAATDPCSRENETVALGENLISKHSADLAVGREPAFHPGMDNFVDTVATTDDSKLSSVDDVNNRETSQDYETEIQEAIDNQERAGVLEEVNDGQGLRKLLAHSTTERSLSLATDTRISSPYHTVADSTAHIFSESSPLSISAFSVARSNPSGESMLASVGEESLDSSKRKAKSKALPSRVRRSPRSHPSDSSVSEHSKLDLLRNVDIEKDQIISAERKHIRLRKDKKQDTETISELPPLHPNTESISLATQRVTRLRLALSKVTSIKPEDSNNADDLGTVDAEKKHLTNTETVQTRLRRARRQESEDKSDSLPCSTEAESTLQGTQRKGRILMSATSAVLEKAPLKRVRETPFTLGAYDLSTTEASKPLDLLQTSEAEKAQLNSTGTYLTRSRRGIKQTRVIPELPPCVADTGAVPKRTKRKTRLLRSVMAEASENAEFPETPTTVNKTAGSIPLSDITVESGSSVFEEPLRLASQRAKRTRREINQELDDMTKMSTETKPPSAHSEASAGTRRSTRLCKPSSRMRDYILPSSGRLSSEVPSPSSLQASATLSSGHATRSQRSGSSTAVASSNISRKKAAPLRSTRAKKK